MDQAVPTDLNSNPAAIVVTTSRLPEPIDASAASVSLVDKERLERLGEPAIASYLRLLPSTAISTSGPAGSFTEVRIRGAEANHTLLFIDGIRANDPAAGNQPRSELLNADIASRIELVRGPQSALWGSEAIGGVIAVSGDPALGNSVAREVEAGSFGFRRASGSASISGANYGLALAAGHQQADGIDSFDGHGDRDGFSNNAVRGIGRWAVAPKVELVASGFWLGGRSDFDGLDPVTFLRADTLDRTRNRLAAGRIGIGYGEVGDAWQAKLSASRLGSRNLNLLDDSEVNVTRGRRATVDAEVAHRFATGAVQHALIVAASSENEHFEASDVAFGGFTDQSRSRKHVAVTGEWRASLADRVVGDVAVRRDSFDRFKDALTLRASVLVKLAKPVTAAVSYGEGIAQPTFFDLYGFFPGSFVGNPALRPESSRGFEASLRYKKGAFAGSLTAYRQHLRDEIVGTFSAGMSSAANADGISRRQGIEAEASWHWGQALRLSANYAFLEASEPSVGGGNLKEVRRPRHSGSVTADGLIGKLSYGASVSYVGRRADTDFDLFQRVSLSPYWLAGARVAYAVRPGVQWFVRVANAFDAHYQDVVGYRTEGRSGYAGLRVALDR
jgi:vitamin B12 transporter